MNTINKSTKSQSLSNTKTFRSSGNVAKQNSSKNGCCGCIVMFIVVSMIAWVISGLFRCTQNLETEEKHITEQEKFAQMLENSKEKRPRIGNNIKEKEYCDSIQNSWIEYMDSIKLFVNWKGRIKSINSEECGNQFVILSFALEHGEDYDPSYTFKVHYVLPKDSITTDKIYQTVKSVDDNSLVYYDGFIRKKSEGKLHTYFDDDDYKMYNNPEFEFLVKDVNTKSKGDTLTYNLRNAIELSYIAKRNLNMNGKRKISKMNLDMQLDAIEPYYKEAKGLLTQEELSYIDRLTQAFTYELLPDDIYEHRIVLGIFDNQ